MAPGDALELGRDADAARGPRRGDRIVRAGRDHQPAPGDPEVERLVPLLAGILEERVAPRDAGVRRAVFEVGRHVLRPEEDEAHRRTARRDVRVEDQPAGLERVFPGHDPHRREQRERLAEDAPLRDRDGQPLLRRRGHIGTLRMRAPSWASFSSMHS